MSSSIDLKSLSKPEIFLVNLLHRFVGKPVSKADMDKTFLCIVKTLCSRYLEEKGLSDGPKTLADSVKKFAEKAKVADSVSSEKLNGTGEFFENLAVLARKAYKSPEKFRWNAVVCTNIGNKSSYEKHWEAVDSTSQYVFLKRGKDNYSAKELFVARVLYSETSSIATEEELKMICKVIMNRVKNKAFGNGEDAYSVVKMKNQFTCIDDPNNSNWNEFPKINNNYIERAKKYAKKLLEKDVSELPVSEAVYYHDYDSKKSGDDARTNKIVAAWTNKYWKPELVKTTEHFKFYKAVSASKSV